LSVGGGREVLAKGLLALATVAGQTVVDAAAADEWETAWRGFAQVLGRGNAEQTHLAEQRLKETREQLTGADGTDVGLFRTALAIRWAGRLADLLEENPAAEADLRTLVEEIQAMLPAETESASNHAVSADGAVNTGDNAVNTADGAVSTADAENAAAEAASTDAAEEPGAEHHATLAARSELAYSTGLAGDAAAARDQFAALVPAAERVLGPRHPDSLAARASLAYWTGQAGNAAAARDQFAALLPVRERVSGPDHPDTLAAREGLAYWTGRAGNAAAARDQFAALARVRERVLGPEHAETLAVWYQLAYWTALAGDGSARQD
jgi:Tetratricopeptide repeat